MLFVVQNTFQGDGIVTCLVEADAADAACDLARPKFEESGRQGRYPERYWAALTAKPAPLLQLFESDI